MSQVVRIRERPAEKNNPQVGVESNPTVRLPNDSGEFSNGASVGGSEITI